jgi:predicted RNase H-like HicB family nuclease
VVEEVTRYTATARRSGGWWMVQCDQLPGALSQVRSLAKAADVHREAIAFVSGQAADEIDVDVHAELAPDLAAELEAAEKLAEAARDSLDAAGRKRRAVARQLAQQGITMRDIGTLFGVSHQRAQQLVSD